MSTQQPLVTIVSPCYNHSKYIIESLNSIKQQTYTNIHHIIIDDCSKDNSVELIEQWINKNNYQCQFIKHKKNMGIANTLNESIELTEGRYWSPLATDDFILPTRTEDFLSALNDNSGYDIVVSDCKFVNERSEIIALEGYSSFTRYALRERNDFNLGTGNYGSFDSLLGGNYIASSLMAHTEAIKKAGLFKKNCRIEDWDMWLRLAQQARFMYIDRQLTCYRVHPTNTIRTDKKIPFDALKSVLDQKSYCYGNGHREKFETVIINQWYIALYEKKYKFLVEILKVFPTLKLIRLTWFRLLEKIKLSASR